MHNSIAAELRHPHPQVHATRGYIAHSVTALDRRGIALDRAWLDPFNPVDATIVLSDGTALVWSEDTGWTRGTYVSGEQGLRTEYTDGVALGGGVLLDPDHLAELVATGRTEAPFAPREIGNGNDGLFYQLAGFNN
ncbi:DUF6292 family protein [Actinocorallia sp. A-T 12471]|uniref:DUF6292 family protein n=1 Tax=Actinocorallia sp. A-T 12471 TaxID=3089813 RepID=UPI0029CDBC7C|nr:DUF6292 family protein [Actinocorallia sp. A-T 12471]MDX6738461.1 DUF6292 family protein [Actinocorallia sp. A-T 12471]